MCAGVCVRHRQLKGDGTREVGVEHALEHGQLGLVALVRVELFGRVFACFSKIGGSIQNVLHLMISFGTIC